MNIFNIVQASTDHLKTIKTAALLEFILIARTLLMYMLGASLTYTIKKNIANESFSITRDVKRALSIYAIVVMEKDSNQTSLS